MALRPKRRDEPFLSKVESPSGVMESFDRMIDNWFPITYALNNLNRGMGLPDGYPFVLSAPAIEKLRFVHETITQSEAGRNRAENIVPRVGSAVTPIR